MKRFTLVAALLTIIMVCNFAVAAPPAASDVNEKIIARLDNILMRLDSIEERLAKLEMEVSVSTQWWVDDNGVMRTISGRDIGFWGVDGMNSVLQQRH